MKELILFEKAYDITMKNEGGYANNPKDKGGETYKGISRKYHPNWGGWKLIDAHKAAKPDYTASSINKYGNNPTMNKLVKDFYKANFWDALCLDKCFSQAMANELFDDGVNRGVGAVKKTLCSILGIRTNTSMKNIMAKYNEVWEKKL